MNMRIAEFDIYRYSENCLTAGKKVSLNQFRSITRFTVLFVSMMFACQSCNYGQSKDQAKSQELISVRTLGLAYLEEFKLPEAEKEFLKFIKLAPKEKLGYANLGLVYLRMGKYPEAEKQLLRAIKIDPKDPDIRLILATVYRMNDSRDKAIAELQEGLKASPNHIKTLYDISEIYSTGTDKASGEQRELYTRKLVGSAPANVVPRLNLIDLLIRKGNYDEVISNLEILKKQYPEFPKEAAEYYNRTMTALRSKAKENALNSFTIFHNYIKVTAPYQAGMMDLKGPGGSLVGFPLISFDEDSFTQTVASKGGTTVIKFTNATSSAGLDRGPREPSGGSRGVAAAGRGATACHAGDLQRSAVRRLAGLGRPDRVLLRGPDHDGKILLGADGTGGGDRVPPAVASPRPILARSSPRRPRRPGGRSVPAGAVPEHGRRLQRSTEAGPHDAVARRGRPPWGSGIRRTPHPSRPPCAGRGR